MVDPISATEIALHGISICISAGKLIRKTIEDIKRVKDDLIKLVQEIERHRNVFSLLKSMTRELLRTPFKDMELAIDRTQILNTLDELQIVAKTVAETSQKSGQLLSGIHWSFKKTQAEKLVVRLKAEQAQLMAVVSMINA
jgi:hypothetical protein